ILPSITVEIKEPYFDEMSFYFMYLEALENSIPEGYIYKYHERVELNKIVACMQKGSVEVDSTATVQYINFETKEVMETIKNVPFQIVQYEHDSYTESEMQLGWVETQNNYDAYHCEHFNT
ncbi:MAG: hypothetical protein KBT48_03080, partial [Firmicutes bacterium]|nr:hypothetical protein [Bacillota bacterium]